MEILSFVTILLRQQEVVKIGRNHSNFRIIPPKMKVQKNDLAKQVVFLRSVEKQIPLNSFKYQSGLNAVTAECTLTATIGGGDGMQTITLTGLLIDHFF